MPLPLTVSCFTKIQIGFTFLVLAHPGSPGQRAIKRVCVCVCRVARRYYQQWSVQLPTSNGAIARHSAVNVGSVMLMRDEAEQTYVTMSTGQKENRIKEQKPWQLQILSPEVIWLASVCSILVGLLPQIVHMH